MFLRAMLALLLLPPVHALTAAETGVAVEPLVIGDTFTIDSDPSLWWNRHALLAQLDALLGTGPELHGALSRRAR